MTPGDGYRVSFSYFLYLLIFISVHPAGDVGERTVTAVCAVVILRRFYGAVLSFVLFERINVFAGTEAGVLLLVIIVMKS